MREKKYSREAEELEEQRATNFVTATTKSRKLMNRRYDFEIFNDPKTFKDVCKRNKFN